MIQDTVLALDLEGTLISNAMSQIPRRGLYRFLELCAHHIERVVLYTAVRRELALEIVQRLSMEGEAPPWFASIQYVEWSGPYKRLAFVGAGESILVDDQRGYIFPGEEERWVAIREFESPYVADDELERVWSVLSDRLGIKGQW